MSGKPIREHVITLRCTTAERDALLEAARHNGSKTLSDFIRSIGTRHRRSLQTAPSARIVPPQTITATSGASHSCFHWDQP